MTNLDKLRNVVETLGEYENGNLSLNKTALIHLHKTLINELQKYRKIKKVIKVDYIKTNKDTILAKGETK